MLKLMRSWFFPNWLLFAADDGGSSGSGNGDGSGQNAGKNQNQDDGKRSFTQAELDALFAERAKYAANKAVTDLLAEFNVKDADELKTRLTKASELEQAQMTELQKAQKEAADAKAAQVQADKAKFDALALANERLMRGAVLALAANFNDPADAWAHVDRAKVTVDDTGEVKGAKEAVEALAKAKPYLLKGAQTSPRGTPRPGGRSSTKPTDGAPAKSTVRF
jgi:hypothetical protein